MCRASSSFVDLHAPPTRRHRLRRIPPHTRHLRRQSSLRLRRFQRHHRCTFRTVRPILRPTSADSGGAGGLYREFLNNRNAVADRDTPPSTADVSPPPPSSAEVLPPPRTTAEAEYQDKEVISETVQDQKESDAGAVSDLSNYRRSQSEKWKGETGKMMRRKQLRRSETEKRRENAREILYPQDKLSNEEFQRAIEAFIAKQMRFLREESSAIVVQNPS
ncbi:hypothetical protein SESBI_14179 [Sesbania bispinosa]|nr:hypothetical protein SESBI_14179 [Sesbania bispinosa]